MGIAAHGTKLKIGDGGSPVTYTTIAEVVEISGPGLSADTADTTNHDSSKAYEEHVVTILRTGEVSFDINYLPTDSTHDEADGLINDYENKTKRNFQIVLPNSGSTTYEFSAFVTGFEPSAPHDDKLSSSVTLKITGEPTYNA